MGSIQKRPDGRWRARVRVDGREVAKHFRRKLDAEMWVTSQESKKMSGEWTNPRDGRITVREYGEQWRLVQAHRESTADRYERGLRLHTYPILGDRPLAALRPTEIEAWMRHLDTYLAPATAFVVVETLRMMLYDAVRDRLIGRHPMTGIKTRKPDKHLIRPLSSTEVASILDGVPDWYRAPVALGAGCGLRVSEILALTPGDIDFLRRRVRVDRQLLRSEKTKPYRFGPPKTRTSKREVPLPEPVALELAAHMAKWPPVFVDGLGAELVFTGPRSGLPVGRELVSRWVSTAAKAAKIPTEVTFHDLRHHYASLLIGMGLSVKAVQTALGHANASMTLDIYAHLWPAEEDAMASAVERAWKTAERENREAR